ncbi:MAG: prepilin-type N-terminal cleavage/methylation domain-containing protein [Ruminococcus sp.]|nr:prepilin-type N-terminal cleavage/methylation domain-containing protein [Ruminococcus sp.]MCM1380421.1 prepilin-type N-terminal cleavage/methylation domain-containing protein [Muribaculaceae bacterium]MCM1478911.1 prepilin-type N-terminal cleavage/methylation domain-containing protein [Muribaculaceae bacterium]
MIKKLKGFTLVELVVVMAIMSILMVAIMNMWKPAREIYVDSTQYEAQRTAQNGVVQYITESVRYATDMGVYNTSSMTASNAAKAFAEAYCDANGYKKTDATNLTKIYKHLEIIMIDNKTPHYSKDFKGRVVRRKVDGTSTVINQPIYTATTDGKNQVIVPSNSNTWRTALSEAYYGENTFNITFDISDATNGMLGISVSSTRNGKRDISNASITNASVTANVTKGAVLCRNLTSTNGGVSKPGIFDTDTTKYTGGNTENAYIVFVNKDGKDAIEAEGLTPA